MTIRAWLTTNEFDPEADGLRLGRLDDGIREITIPAVQMGTGGRTASYPGIFHDPRVRTFSDKIATPTGANDPRPITFMVRLEGDTYDTVRRNWSAIENLLNRAEEAASPWPRGTGVFYIEQWEDATDLAVWDVISGVITDQDLNLPGTIQLGAVIQLVVRPFARPVQADALVTAYGDTLPNPATPYVSDIPGDTDAITELRIKDVSDSGNVIARLRIGLRGYQTMTDSDFTPFYARSDTITTGSTYAPLGSAQSIDAGDHQGGLVAIHAIVNDASPVIGTPTITGNSTPNAGMLSDGVWQYVWMGRDASDRWGPPSNLLSLEARNPLQGTSAVNPVQILMAETFFDGEPGRIYPGPRQDPNGFRTDPSATVGAIGTVTIDDHYTMLTVPHRCQLHSEITLTAAPGSGQTTYWGAAEALVQAGQQAWPASGIQSFRVNVELVSGTALVGVLTAADGFPSDSETFSTIFSVAIPDDSTRHDIEMTAAKQTAGGTYFRASIDGVPQDGFLFNDGDFTDKVPGFAVVALASLSADSSSTPGASDTAEVDVYSAYLADGILGGATIAGGSENTVTAEALENATENWLFWQLTTQSAGQSVTSAWWGLNLGAATSYTHDSPVPDGVVVGMEPPLGPLAVQPAQLRAKIGGSSALLYPQKPVSPRYANGIDELVNLGVFSLPGGALPDYGAWPSNGVVAIEGRSGGTNTDSLTLRGLLSFPMDGLGREQQVMATAAGLGVRAEWRIGVTRFGYAYAHLYDADTSAFLGAVPVSGRLSFHEGDNQLVIVAERQDTAGRYVADLTVLKMQFGSRMLSRWHLGPTPAAGP